MVASHHSADDSDSKRWAVFANPFSAPISRLVLQAKQDSLASPPKLHRHQRLCA